MKIFLIFLDILFIFNCCILAEEEPEINVDRVNDPFPELTTFCPALDRKTNDTFMILNDPANYKSIINQAPEYFLSSDTDNGNIVPKVDKLNSAERLRPISRSEYDGSRLFNKDLIKRSAGDGGRRKNIPKGKRKKAKVLGRLLMNNKNDEVTQDDHVEEQIGNHFNRVQGKKMVIREDFQNEDEPSIMELIAFNTRRKTNVKQRGVKKLKDGKS